MALKPVALFLMSVVAFSCLGRSTKPGVIDATSVDFGKDRLNLSGTWTWYDNKLLSPSELKYVDGVPTQVPGTWNERRSNQSGQGVATYAITVIISPTTEQLALEMPDMYSSYVLFANGKEITRNGQPGKTAQTTIPQWRPRVVPLQYDSDTIHLVLQIANFSHHKGGMKEPILLGSSTLLTQKEVISIVGKEIAVTLLLVIALGFFVVYFMTGRKNVVIYFSLLCLTWVIRLLFSNDYLITRFYPDFDWTTCVRIEYITLYLTMAWAILFLCRLFRNEGNQVVKYILVAFNLAFTVFTLLTPPVEFTRLLPLYLITAGILLVYGTGIVLLALINDRRGATFLTISVLLGLAIYSYDIIAYSGWAKYNAVVLSAGYLIMFLLTGIALLLHLEILKSGSTATTVLTYEDLYGKDS